MVYRWIVSALLTVEIQHFKPDVRLTKFTLGGETKRTHPTDLVKVKAVTRR